MGKHPIILASSSPYRKAQLQQLGVQFTTQSPDIDESKLEGESPRKLTLRLAKQKAQKILKQHPEATIIGSDQVCSLAGEIFGKPLTASKALAQLQLFSGQCVEFFTALYVTSQSSNQLRHIDVTQVYFRNLNTAEIKRYISRDQPLDCAGGFKVESLGLSLFSAVKSSDPSALMGLPLIKLAEFLRTSGHQVP